MISRLPEKQRGDCRDVVGDGHPSPMDDANTGDLTLIYKLLTIHVCYSFRVAFATKRFAK